MNVLVKYGVLVDLATALRCRRCTGKGHERFEPEKTCPRCGGSGVRPDGWAYDSGPFRVEVGSIVETEPTPYTNGERAVATVVALDTDEPATKRLLGVIHS